MSSVDYVVDVNVLLCVNSVVLCLVVSFTLFVLSTTGPVPGVGEVE